MAEQAPAGWHADPFGRYERRYWDGRQWTQHVGSGGRQGTDQPGNRPVVPSAPAANPAAGWYPDPNGNRGRRYWDGNQWTNHADPSAGGRPAPDRPVNRAATPGATPVRVAAGWYPDPTGNRGRRYWDGNQWTDHADPDTGGRPGPNPIANPATAPPISQPNKKVARQARKAGAGAGQPGGGTLFTEQVLVVNQKAKMFGSTLGYAVYNKNGQQLGTVQEVRRDLGKKVTDSLLGRPDSKKMHRFQLVDMNGRLLLQMTRPQIGWFKMKGKLVIEGPGATPIGQIELESFGILRHARFGLVAGGQRLGSVHAESTEEWDFKVQDPDGTEVARITKTWAGWAKERFTKADNYVVQMHRPLQEPMRSLVIAAALAIDVELKQNGVQTAGSSVWGTRRYA